MADPQNCEQQNGGKEQGTCANDIADPLANNVVDNDDDDIGALQSSDIVQVIPLEDDENAIDNESGDEEENGMDIEEHDENQQPSQTQPLGDEQLRIVDQSVMQFNEHTQDVFAITSYGQLCCSGGQDDVAFVWNINDGHRILKCTGHTDSVTFVRFNHNGTKLATADLSGSVRVWNGFSQEQKNKAKPELLTEFNDAADLEWIEWHSSADILLAGDKEGSIWMWLAADKGSPNCKVFSAGNISCTTGVLLTSGKELLAGYDDGTIRMWNLKSAESKLVTVSGAAAATEGLNGSITSATLHPSQPLAAFGNDQGLIQVIHCDATSAAKITHVLSVDLLTPKPPATNNDDIAMNTDEAGGSTAGSSDTSGSDFKSIESLSFAKSDPSLVLAVGSVQGSLSIFDLSAGDGLLRQTCQHPGGVVKCEFIDAQMLLSACLDGIVRLWDARNGQLLRSYTGNRDAIYDFSVTQDKKCVLTAGEDTVCRVFHI